MLKDDSQGVTTEGAALVKFWESVANDTRIVPFKSAIGDAAPGDARTVLFSFRGVSTKNEKGSSGERGAVVAVAETWQTTNPQRRSVLRQGEEKSGCCGEGGAASGASWQGRCCLWRIWQGWCYLWRSAEKTQGGSVSRGRDRGDKESGNNRVRRAALRQALSSQQGVLHQMRFSPTAQSVHGAISPAEWFVVAGCRRASRPAGIGLPSVREGCGRRADKFWRQVLHIC